MNLKDFVKESIVDILGAVKEASKEMDMNGEIFVGTKADKRCIEFDIAVSVEKNESKKGGVGIKVLEFVKGKGELANEVKNSTVSRIQFGIYTPNPKGKK